MYIRKINFIRKEWLEGGKKFLPSQASNTNKIRILAILDILRGIVLCQSLLRQELAAHRPNITPFWAAIIVYFYSAQIVYLFN
jgi:hypothetical protein